MEKKLTVADLKVGMVFETVYGREPRKLVARGTGYAAIHPDNGYLGGVFDTLEDLLLRFNEMGVYTLRPEPTPKRVLIPGLKFMCEKPNDRQLVAFSDGGDVYHVINPNTGRVVWRDIDSRCLQELFDDGFYRFNPANTDRVIGRPPELAAGYGAQQCSPAQAPTPYDYGYATCLKAGNVVGESKAADSVELHFANGTIVTVSVK